MKLIKITKINNLGITIVELMIVIAIVAMIMAIGVVSFKTLGANNRLNAISRDIYYDFIFAKTKAMEGQTCVTILFNRTLKINGTNSTIDYLITESKTCDTNDLSNILKIKKLDKNISITLSNNNPLTFDQQGFINGVNNKTLTIKVKTSNKTIARDLTINRLGRIRLGNIYEAN